ncbi:class I SAM-dependent methyltransferase [Arenimonas fontis]|uniref:Class I SAM-dependent methyltransferase n=1 Tax=Arenimonas fontis TaxID=2608255 RepID=A0A5B2ZCX0_9GAMM|nr:methyltransferase [Arenimonas fontis]KAA2285050.1 class I SAM-dependent methyltransferase [Arenimonas fontis]
MALPPDPELETLLLPLRMGELAWPAQGGALLLRARAGAALQAWRGCGLVCEQSFRPWAEALARAGFELSEASLDPKPGPTPVESRRYPLVMLLAPRQRDESRALLARAVDACAPGGVVLACAGNKSGGRPLQDDLQRLAGPVRTLSKHHCRASWTGPLAETADPALLEAWRSLDAPRPILDGRYLSRPGLFAWDRADPGSTLLLEQLPADLAGAAADLGAGWGFLGAELLARCPGITSLDLFEAEARALALARRNLAAATMPVRLHWHDVAGGVPGRYDVIVCNPPFHQGRADRPELGRAFIATAAAALKPGGCLWLVANRHLPYESALASDFAHWRVAAERDGFKVFEARKGPA